MGAPVLTRLGLARDLQSAREAQVEARRADNTGHLIVATKRVSAVRAALLGLRAAGAEGIDVMDPLDAIKRATEHFQALAESGADEVQVAEDKLILKPVLRYVESVASTAKLDGNTVSRAVSQLSIPNVPMGFPDAQLARFAGASTVVDSLRDSLTRGKEAYEEATAAENQVMAELNDEQKHAFEELRNRLNPGKPGGSTYDEYYDAHQQLVDEFKDRRTVAAGKRQVALARAGATLREAGTSVISAFKEWSPVSEQQAVDWAAKQEISKAAATRMKKGGYPVEQVRADMAEFYRLSAGRLGAVQISTNGSRRANATGIHGHGSAVINIDGDFDKRTLWHELGHHLESAPSILWAAKAFLNKRSDGSGLHTLRSLTGNTGYRPSEKAYRDHFFSHYVGKFYPDATEVMSMAMESLSDPLLLGQRMAQDPEIFKLLEGVMKTPANKLMKLIHDVREKNATVQAEFMEAQADARAVLIKEVASRITLRPDMPSVNPVAMERIEGGYKRIYSVQSYVGAHIDGTTVYLVYQAAKVTEYTSGFDRTRPKKGHVIFQVSIADGLGFVGNNAVARCQVVGDLDEVRARIFDWIKNGRPTERQLMNETLKTYAQQP